MLLGLSYWQLQRGFEKQHIANLRTTKSDVVISSAPSNWAEYNFQDATLYGEWSPENAFLLENRVNKGQVGLEVLAPFKLADDQSTVLINRGWVANADEANEHLTGGRVKIRGVIYQPKKGLTLGDAILPEQLATSQLPKHSVFIDMNTFSQVLQQRLEDVIFVLDETNPLAYLRIWTATAMPAERHYGYAIQWLGLAITFLIYGVIWFRRNQK